MAESKIDNLQVTQIARQIKNSILEFCKENASAFEEFKKKLPNEEELKNGINTK